MLRGPWYLLNLSSLLQFGIIQIKFTHYLGFLYHQERLVVLNYKNRKLGFYPLWLFSYKSRELLVKIIAYIESPLQALNAIEYVNRFGSHADSVFLLRKGVEEKNYKQIIGVLELFDYQNTRVIDLEGTFTSLYKGKNAVLEVLKEFLGDKSLIFVLGEYRSLPGRFIANYLPFKEVVIVDDGNATFEINRTKFEFDLNSLIKNFLFSFKGIKTSLNHPLTFFTIYNLESRLNIEDKVICNDYSYCKSLLLGEKPDNRVFIIGSPLRMARVVDDDISLTIKLIEKCKKRFLNFELIYFAHRREEQEKLDEIKKTGVSVVQFEYPLELYPFVCGSVPKHIVGFVSSLFDNIPLIFGGGTKITSFVIPRRLISLEQKNIYKEIYCDYMASENIDVVPFE